MIEAISAEDAYLAARQSLIAVRLADAFVLELRGSNRLDLLHRMSTNDVESLANGEWRQTVFTDPVGRTIELVTVIAQAERTLLLCASDRSDRLQDWLQRHIFFQDDVTIEQPSGERSLWGVYGPHADQVLRDFKAQSPAGESIAVFDGGIAWKIEQPVGGYLLLITTSAAEAVLAQRGGGSSARDAFEILRVEAGLPASGHEIQDDSIPLEVGLRRAISFTKGCYTGQEIIARLDSRGKLAKQLIGLRLAGVVQAGSELRQGGRTIGSVTSVANSPDLGWIALGSIRSAAATSADPITDEVDRVVEVVELPFPEVEN
jgi:aminomethyltransferase